MDNHKIVVDKNGTTTLATKDRWCDRDVEIVANVKDGAPILQDKSATPTKQTQTFNADEGYDGIGTFTVGAIPNEYIVPSGTASITANGTHDVTDKASVNVNVPIPSGYIVPSGTAQITTNGTHNVTQYASANVNVPIPLGYIIPSGTITITNNGTHDVTNYASAVVNVSSVDDLANYSRAGAVGSSGSVSTTRFYAGGVLPEKFYFFATCTDINISGTTNSMTAYQFKHTFNGKNYVTVNAVGAVSSTIERESAITVSEDRTMITVNTNTAECSTGLIRTGTWFWTIMTEG